MKTIIIALLLVAAYGTNAQPQHGIMIINNSNCTVWFTLKGNTSTGCLPIPYTSQALSIPCCSTSVTYSDPTAVPGGMQNSSSVYLTSSDFITQITIHNSDPAGICYVSSVRLNDCITSSTHYVSDPIQDCNDDCTLTLSWAPATGGATHSTVTIN